MSYNRYIALRYPLQYNVIMTPNRCVNGLYRTTGFYPKFLLDLQSDVQVISYGGCLIQAYVIYTSVLCEITILTVMSYDRL
ncbi:unnamed protein product, partial [Coregonus sp. 'balchen']